MPGDANFDQLTEGLPVSWQVVLNGIFLIIIAAATAYGYLRTRAQAKTAPAPLSPTMQVIGGTLANRDAVEHLAGAIEALTAELKAHRSEAAEKIEKEELLEELMEKVRKEQRKPPARR